MRVNSNVERGLDSSSLADKDGFRDYGELMTTGYPSSLPSEEDTVLTMFVLITELEIRPSSAASSSVGLFTTLSRQLFPLVPCYNRI